MIYLLLVLAILSSACNPFTGPSKGCKVIQERKVTYSTQLINNQLAFVKIVIPEIDQCES